MRWAGQVQFVGVAWFGDDDSFQNFIHSHGLTFPQVSDDAGDVYNRFDIPTQPALVLIGPDGSAQRLFGEVDEERLDRLLGESLS